jgi:predicted CXXCH cytochrome family protein
MSNKWAIVFFILIGIIAVVYGLSGEPHEFSSGECSICHVDEKSAPMNLNPGITSGCETCHSELKKTQSHPTDMYPSLSIPKDLPLIEGRLTCITCHYVHPAEKNLFIKKHYFLRRQKKHYFLRRQVRGPYFCSVCHKLDEKGHIIFISENVHAGSYKVTDTTTLIDRMSLECIECHDRYITEPVDSLGAGKWEHFNKKSTHPIGVSYKKIRARKMREYQPASMLRPEIRLFDGKIGCGTCHNIYSKESFILVMSNRESRLCLECHIK